MIKEMVDKIVYCGANVVFCQKGIDDFAQYLLARAGIYGCRRVSRSDLEKISKATNGKIVSNLNELAAEDLGEAGIVEEIKNGDDIFTYVKDCQELRALTILIRGGSEHVIDEIERAFRDGIGDVISAIETELVVPGGGAIEVELSRRLKEFAQSLQGREQLAVYEFAEALEFIPTTLAENAGLDPIEIISELKSKHDAGELYSGLNLFNNKIQNVIGARIIEPYRIKSQAISSATEVAVMILRIDDVIASKPAEPGKSGVSGYMESLE